MLNYIKLPEGILRYTEPTHGFVGQRSGWKKQQKHIRDYALNHMEVS